MESDPARQWFVRLPPRQSAPVQVLAFPSAGNGCSFFAPLARRAAGLLDVWSLNLPGRQARFREPFRTRYAPLVDDLCAAVPDILDGRPYVLLGYCSGALLAFGMADALRTSTVRPPAGLVAASFAPPHDRIDLNPSGSSADQFWHQLVSYGAVPAELAGAEYRALYEPVHRADYALVSDYQHRPVPPFTETAVCAVVGRDDPVLAIDRVRGWSTYTTARFTVRPVEGGHWLMEEPSEELVRQLIDEAYLQTGASGGRPG